MIQRKQTLFLMAAIILTVMCLSMQIGSFEVAGIGVSKVYNLWFTDPIGKHHFDTWPLMAVRRCSACSMLCCVWDGISASLS